MKPFIVYEGNPRSTFRILSTDTEQNLPSTYITRDGKLASSTLITCEDNDIRFTFGDSTPTQGVDGLGHILYKGQSIKLVNANAIQTFKFINAVNASVAILQVTTDFIIGG